MKGGPVAGAGTRARRRSHRWLRRVVSWMAAPACLVQAACDRPHYALDPAADAAAGIAWLWWVLFWVCLFVFVAVLAGWTYGFLRRRPPGTEPEPTGRALTWVLVAGGLIPAAILVMLTAATILSGARIAGVEAEGAVEIEVVGHQFWWEVRYPESGVVTANEIHVPAGRPVRLRLHSADVIHSLWVPRLHGKLDLTPGRVTEMVLEPREPGEYRGFCAEFCGLQHALMGLLVIAQPEAEFRQWLARQAEPAAAPADPARARGRDAFLRYDCHLCHRVRGAGFPATPAETGPDLTHVGARRTLGAVTVENTSAALAAWIADPHTRKPGVRMPATRMPDEELRALVAYLEGLR